jgi:hypothetical protein
MTAAVLTDSSSASAAVLVRDVLSFSGRGPADGIPGPWLLETAGAREWDEFLRRAAGGDLAQSSLWAEVKSRLGVGAHIVLLRRQGGIVAGGALLVRRIAPGLRVGYVARGPVVDPGHADLLPVVLDELLALARELGVRYLIVQPPEGGEWGASVLGRGFRAGGPAVAPEAIVRVDLDRDEEEILRGMRRSRRRGVVSAPGRGARLVEGTREDVPGFWSLYAATAARQGFEPLPLRSLLVQWDVLADRGAVRLFQCAVEGEIVSGIWMTAFGDSVTTKLSGWTGGGGHASPNDFLDWCTMRWAKGAGYRWYDLGGLQRSTAEAVVDGRPLDQVAGSRCFYKLGFGGEVTLLPRAMHGFPPRVLRPVSPLLGLAGSRVQRAATAVRVSTG